MAKNPILPLYYNDISRSTSTWTDEEFGAYMRLLIEQWDKGSLPKDCQRLARLVTSLPATWCMLSCKFPEVDGVLKNTVMEEIREKHLRHREKQSINASKRYQTSANIPAKTHTKKLPLEYEYENEINNTVSVNEISIKNIATEICKIFKRSYVEPADRMPAMANWYSTIELQAKVLFALGEGEAIKQIKAYIKHCENTNRKLIGTDFKVAETILSANWVGMLSDTKPDVNKFSEAEYNKTLWTLEAWNENYKHQITTNPEFKKHFKL